MSPWTTFRFDEGDFNHWQTKLESIGLKFVEKQRRQGVQQIPRIESETWVMKDAECLWITGELISVKGSFDAKLWRSGRRSSFSVRNQKSSRPDYEEYLKLLDAIGKIFPKEPVPADFDPFRAVKILWNTLRTKK